MTTCTTLFISDLHLDPQHPDITRTFFYFLDHMAKNTDALYILGDLFEVYIGDDDNSDFMQSIKRKIATFTQSGPPTFLMHGNRDFLIRKQFAKETGVTLLEDPTVISLYHQKLLLMHGDSLCTLDNQHQRSRRWARNWLLQTLCLQLPLKKRQMIAARLRKNSSLRHQTKTTAFLDVTQEAVTQVIQAHQATRLIHGHTHRPAIYADRIVLNAWHDHGNYLEVNANGDFKLIDFR